MTLHLISNLGATHIAALVSSGGRKNWTMYTPRSCGPMLEYLFDHLGVYLKMPTLVMRGGMQQSD